MAGDIDPSRQSEMDALDREIGARLRHVRNLRGLTQTDLGKVVDVSFQQIQKYERGTNRISTSALILLARALEVSPGELLVQETSSAPQIDWDLLSEDGAHTFLQVVNQISSAQDRRIIILLARELAARTAADRWERVAR
jgi:transcriptional regulator with XRE-family HTH domain